MKLFKYFGVAAAVLALPLTGCSDFLDADNLSNANQNADDYFANDPDALRVVMYDDFRPIVNTINLQDQGADLYINPRGADDGTYSMYNHTPLDGDIASFYKNLYKGINHANALIKYAPEGSQLAAEAIFFRNWGYYYLTQHFGDVPYVTAYIETATRDYPRVSISEIYPAMLAELEQIYNSSVLPDTDHKGNVSKQAVAALAAKVALAAGWDLETTLNNEVEGTYTVNGNSYFNKAAQWAEKAINGVQLTMSFEDKWSPKNEGNAEEIFSIQYERAGYPGNEAEGGHSLMYDYMGYYGNCVSVGQKGTKSGGTNCHSIKSLQMWEKGDARFWATFMTTCYNSDNSTGTPVWGTEGYLAYYNATAAQLAEMPIAYIFYPPYMTEAEVKADLAKKSTQTVKKGKALGIEAPAAILFGYDQVTRWMFNTNGSLASPTRQATLEFMKGNASGNGMCVKKFDDPKSDCVTSSNCYRDIPVFHVSDMYLVAAEAYLLAGNEAQSLQKINAVRGRAGLPALASFDAYELPYVTNSTYKQTKLDLVLDERARELYAERTRWEDLRRTRQLVKYNIEFARSIASVENMQNAKGQTKWYRPIPQSEIDNNTSMDQNSQNPGY